MAEEEQEKIPPPRRLRTTINTIANSYFIADTYNQVASELNTRRPQLVIARLGVMWRQMTPDKRLPFIQQLQKDRVRYRKPKDPNAPRKPATAYVLFKREMGQRVREQMKTSTVRERQKEVVRRWRQLDDNTREKYKRKAADDKVRFVEELNKMRERDRERQRQNQRILQASELPLQLEEPPQVQPPPPAQQ